MPVTLFQATQFEVSNQIAYLPNQFFFSNLLSDVVNEMEGSGSRISSVNEPKMVLSPKAKLGLKASNHLKKGRIMPDELLVDIMVRP